MEIRTVDIPDAIVERIGRCHPRPAFFDYSEFCDWPKEAVAKLKQTGLVIEAEDAVTINCPGCEWHCSKRLVVRLDAAKRRRPYISCDEEPRLGRIPVPVAYLARYQASLRTLSLCTSHLMGFDSADALCSGNGYQLGAIKGRYGTRMVGLLINEGQIHLTVGDQKVPVLSVLSVARNGLLLDDTSIRRLANRKARPGMTPRVPDRTRQQGRKRNTQARNVAIHNDAVRLKTADTTWSDVARMIQGTAVAQGLSFERVRRIISEMRNS